MRSEAAPKTAGLRLGTESLVVSRWKNRNLSIDMDDSTGGNSACFQNPAKGGCRSVGLLWLEELRSGK